MNKDYHISSDPKTYYPYSRLQLFQDLKIPPKQYEQTYNQKNCVFQIKDQIQMMDGYDFQYSTSKILSQGQSRSLRRKVKLRFHCQLCGKWWTSIVGTIQIRFKIATVQKQKTMTQLVNFNVKLFTMQCIICKNWAESYIYESQLITVARIFCLTIAEILDQVPRPKRRIKDDRHKMKEEIHDHKAELCEACKNGKCFARPKNETSRLLK